MERSQGIDSVAFNQPDLAVPLLRCDSCAIRHKAVCGALDNSELAELNAIAHRRHYSAGQIIMSDEESVEFFANIVSGVVKLTKTMSDGRQQIVGLQFAPDFLGRTYGQSNPYFAEAATDLELCCFPHDKFERLLKAHPGLERRLFERTLDELDAAREWMLLLGRKTASEKVASFLLLLARRSAMSGCPHQGEIEAPSFELPLTRSDMADYLGLTIETVSRQITKLKSRRVIKLTDNRHFDVPDVAALSQLAGRE